MDDTGYWLLVAVKEPVTVRFRPVTKNQKQETRYEKA